MRVVRRLNESEGQGLSRGEGGVRGKKRRELLAKSLGIVVPREISTGTMLSTTRL